jgi:hypothetical protein
MADNIAMYGFRFVGGSIDGGRDYPRTIRCPVATSQSFDVNGGAANVGLGRGDPVIKTSTGTVTLCDGVEGAGGPLLPWGIVLGVAPHWSVSESRLVFSDVIPSDVAWGTALSRQSYVYVIPVTAGLWEIDVDDNTTATTQALYQDMVGENVNYILTGASGEKRAKPKLDISNQAVTNTLVCQIENVPPPPCNRDFGGANVKLQVSFNLHAMQSTTGV